MYQIVKVLNNNALLVSSDELNTESILLGKGIGFGRKSGQRIDYKEDVKEYRLEKNDGRTAWIGTDEGIEPIYLEAAGKIIDEARQVFEDIHSGILLPLADHIAFAAKRTKANEFVPNPFIPDIKGLFGREYAVAIKCKDAIKELAGYEITDDEAGFIALHIHSGLSNEQASETLKYTQIINECVHMISKLTEKIVEDDESLTYSRLLSHLYYMVLRTKRGQAVNICLNEFMQQQYMRAYKIASEICLYMEKRLELSMDPMEKGYLAVHIERYLTE